MRTSRITNKKRTDAAAILLALWALFLLAAMVISWALDINSRLTISSSANRVLEAEAMACSGAEVAMHWAVKPGSDVLRGTFPGNQSYQARITGEGGRLNLKLLTQAIVAQGDNSPYRELLRRYLEVKGVDLNERDEMIDTLLDWIDPDNLVRLNGAEDDEGYKPPNMPLKTIDELKRVRGWEEFTSRPDWDKDFTVDSMGQQPQNPQIDVNWASRDVLLALPGLSEGMVDRFMAMRRGQDDLEGTDDDYLFTNPGDVQIALGLRQDQFIQLSPLITTTSPVIRVESVGKSASVTRTVRMVIFKQNNAIRLIS